MASSQGEQKQVTLRLTTRMPAPFRVPPHPLAVPARLTRFGLSEVVNSLLKLDKPTPFDFLINDQLLQVSLEAFLLERNISAESVLSVEYLPALGPFTPEVESPHPDWVSAVTSVMTGLVATGSYDGVARLWSVAQGRSVGDLVGHTAGVTCISAHAGDDEDEDGNGKATAALRSSSLLTGSKDGTARLWRLQASASRVAESSCVAELRGHTEGLAAVVHSPDGHRCATGAWDASLRLWRLDTAAAVEPEAGGKRRKKGDAGAVAQASAAIVAPDATLTGHTGCVSAVCWPDLGTVYTGGWDHTLRCWDVDSGACSSILNDGGSKAVYALHVRPGTQLLAFCGAERAVRVWDTRSGATVANTVLGGGHSSWVTSVRWCPWHEHQLLSAGHDGHLVLWDIRGKAPVHNVGVSADKLLAADWARAPGAGPGARRVAVGGSDTKLHIMSMLQAL